MRDVLAVIGAVCVGIWTLFLVLLALHTSREQWRRRRLARATQRPEDGWDMTLGFDIDGHPVNMAWLEQQIREAEIRLGRSALREQPNERGAARRLNKAPWRDN